MSSRDKILAAVAANQPELTALPDIAGFEKINTGGLEKFTGVLETIGGKIYVVDNLNAIPQIVTELFGTQKRMINLVPNLQLPGVEETITDADAHNLEDVDVAFIKAHFGVAENGAVWVTEERLGQRALPFITQHLAVVIHQNDILPSMHHAYEKLQGTQYNYGSFIAGPSKTADIEQSLVIGAHGPRSMTVFVLAD